MTVKDLHTFDLAAVALDALCYFVVGRWWQKPGADRASVLVPALAGIYVFSAVGGRWHYSISLFSIKCLWPPSLVAAALLIVGVVAFVVVLHAVAFYRDGVLLGRCVEVAATAMIFVLPVCRNSSFHVHHWYWTWLIGLHQRHRAPRRRASLDPPRKFLIRAGGVGQRRRPRLRAEPLRGRRPGVSLRLYASGSGGRRLRARLADLLPRAPLIGSPPPSDLRKHPRSLD